MNIILILLAGVVGFCALPLSITIITWDIMYLDPANTDATVRLFCLVIAIVFMYATFKLLSDNDYKRWF